ncbi:MAG: hypothetical protein KAS32_22710 [Candidatus Peribacteraceae bacterium]|nr:hypothetical protein [Candidatus Peribacteraceae bacterium]
MSRQAREMRQILYPLKRERKEPIQIHQIDTNTANLETGVIDKDYLTYRIKQAIVLPVDGTRNFVYDLAYIAANKNFTGGGFFDKDRTNVIIDMKELPTGIVISLNDYCSISGVTYKVAAANVFEKAFYILQLTTITNFASLEV